MKKIIYFLFFFILFSCSDDDNGGNGTKRPTITCLTTQVDLIENGQTRTELNIYNSLNQLTKKCIQWDGIENGCFLIKHDSLTNTVVYYSDSTATPLDTLFKAVYSNNQIIEYGYGYDFGSATSIYFKYDGQTKKLIELKFNSNGFEQIYDVETDVGGDPIKLSLKSRNSTSVYDEKEIIVTYDNNPNPLRNDLTTRGLLYFFPKKNLNYTQSINFEESIYTYFNYSKYNTQGYPIQSVLTNESGDTAQVRKFSYDCF